MVSIFHVVESLIKTWHYIEELSFSLNSGTFVWKKCELNTMLDSPGMVFYTPLAPQTVLCTNSRGKTGLSTISL